MKVVNQIPVVGFEVLTAVSMKVAAFWIILMMKTAVCGAKPIRKLKR
jgi:hypothetical protein